MTKSRFNEIMEVFYINNFYKYCLKCSCWDPDVEQCNMPYIDHWYACPIDNKKPENKKRLDEYIKFLKKQK